MLAVLAGSAADAAKRPRVPPDKWAIDYAREYCILSRDGVGSEVGVAFRTRPMADEHDLLFYRLPSQKKASFKGSIIRGDGSAAAERWVLVERSIRRQTIAETTITGQEMAEAFARARVRLTGPNGFDVQAPLPDAAKASAALRTCEEDLAKRWGVAPAEMATWATAAKPKSDLRELFWSKDLSKVGMLQSGHVRAVLDIDASGRAVKCSIVERSRVRWVDTKICEALLAEARFDPARDASGRAVSGKVVTPRIRSVRLR